MKIALSALALVAALATPATAQAPTNESLAVRLASALVIVPTYCPGWKVDMPRYHVLLASTGVSEAALKARPLKEKAQAEVDRFGKGGGDKRFLCAEYTHPFGPTGNGLIYPQ